jgi:tetratricopeptide (TPR) repeat protein
MTPKELLYAHRYSDAAEAYRTRLLQHPEQNYYGGLGDALLCLGQFSGAVAAFRAASEMESRKLKGDLPYLNEIGTALWLARDTSGAMAEWHHAVSGILDGSIQYGDVAGGATQGLLLWYGAVTLKDHQEHEYALDYFRYLRRRKTHRDVLWPRPIFEMVLGERTFEEVLATGIGSPNLDTCIKMARTDLLKRRSLCQALFYGACREREAGDNTACMDTMQECVRLENPIIEVEWYLARGECT